MMESLRYIVVVVVVCAAALAFIVLYNLTNINITEREREIATIKVLGFYDSETNRYVFRENIILTVLGALVGLPMGKALHAYVMSQIRIDLMCFDVRVAPGSYLLSAALTLAFGLLVNLALRRKIRATRKRKSPARPIAAWVCGELRAGSTKRTPCWWQRAA